MKTIKKVFEFEIESKPIVNGEFEDFCNWITKCPLKRNPKEVEKGEKNE